MLFIGVTTGGSSILRVYEAWKPHLGLEDSRLAGIDLALDTPAAEYRRVVAGLRDDPEVRGALVTTHKIPLFLACRDLFDEIGADAATLGETSCLTAAGGRLGAHALDPVTSGLALDALVPDPAGRPFLVLGAGGAGLALVHHLLTREDSAALPRVVVTDVDRDRLASVRRMQEALGAAGRCELVAVTGPGDGDAVLAGMGPGAVVVNATGMGKDRPGSPLTGAARFPRGALAWDFNYRGELGFLAQARAQQGDFGLQVEDGWDYFVLGWTQAIAKVFDLDVPVSGARFAELSRVARDAR